MDVFNTINDPNTLVVDARSRGRFMGTEPEPRKGLRGGHIPNSVNFHFEEVIEKNQMRSELELEGLFQKNGIANQSLVFSCGSGLTACIVALAAHQIGKENLSIYDGSWSEWGQPGELPVVQ